MLRYLKIIIIFFQGLPFSYQQSTQPFTEIDVHEVRQMQKSEKEFYLYTGRETCPYCRTFVPKLWFVSKVVDHNIYYLDTENTNIDPEIQAFRDQYEIKYVPNFSQFNGEFIINTLQINDDTKSFDIYFFMSK